VIVITHKDSCSEIWMFLGLILDSFSLHTSHGGDRTMYLIILLLFWPVSIHTGCKVSRGFCSKNPSAHSLCCPSFCQERDSDALEKTLATCIYLEPFAFLSNCLSFAKCLLLYMISESCDIFVPILSRRREIHWHHIEQCTLSGLVKEVV
jgi:hypothetical protein